ncbi:MAG TPA: hypothetical protein VG276_14975 [Actinomycetes bacterium]|jgi:hypothetical protein|nr:hypothetical protein [Actinomycetes bacterium]
MRIRAGFTIEKALGDVQELLRGAQNARTLDRVGYLEWVERAERKLRELFTDRDVVDGLYAGHYQRILQTDPSADARVTRLHSLLQAELAAQERYLEELLGSLRLFDQFRPPEPPASQFLGHGLILDTSVFLNFDPFGVDPLATDQGEAAAQWRQARAQWRTSMGEPADAGERITRAQWRKLLNDPADPRGQIQPTERLRLVVPTLTFNELDGHTHAGNRRLSRSARAALAFLDPFVDTALGGEAAEISPDDPGLTLEILPDMPGHQRQTSNDAELLDRAEFFHQVTGPANAPPVLVATGDRGMRVLGKTLKLANPYFPVRVVAMPEPLRVPPSK